MDIAASILYRISLKTGISPKLIKGKSRKQNIVDARQIYMFALRQLGFSQQFIANKLKYKGMSTYGCKGERTSRAKYERKKLWEGIILWKL